MKISGARSEPAPPVRRRASAEGRGRAAAASPATSDDAAFLGLAETDLTPPVHGALRQLLGEIDELRAEVGRLKARLGEMEDLADRDALTPLLNRRALVRELGRAAAFAARYGAPASLAYFDLDGLKAVNDRLGHAAGDAALKAVAERLAAHVRESDLVGRMGGDEFAVILVQAGRSAAEAKAQALAKAVEREPLRFGGWTAPLRLSWGVAEVAPELTPEEVVAAADRAMYARKRERRGQP